ncbi:hypothetical protein [Streptomyces carpinensis]|uniref:Uncharacterized protein n=1 Tax=Streptomyces carpinensis TaxID=66369 RepID=A0ABV1WDP6_9ACTN|nr:hypothetical protein [Streptomyces carpinensis]
MDEAQDAAATSADDDPTTARAKTVLAKALGCDVDAPRSETDLTSLLPFAALAREPRP